MDSRRGLLLLLALLTATSILILRTHGASTLPPLTNLAPGTDLRIQQNVDVNVVLVGFNGLVSPADILESGILTGWNGVPKANGQGKTFLGQRFDFHYNVVAAPQWFDDALFPFLRAIAAPQPAIPIFQGLPPMPITPFQAFYDFCNLNRTHDPTLSCSFDPAAVRVNKRLVTQNYLLDAAFVEKVLSQNIGPLLGIDVTKPTLVLLDWWGRPDYVDHIYLDGSEPDPDTGFPRGFLVTNELAGYGPTNHNDPETCQGDCIFHRMWFYDVSAGPMGRTGGFNLVADIPPFFGQDFHDGLLPFDYRIHHTSDYGTPGTYRPLDTLVFDVTVAVDVFVSGLAYAAPLYPPALTPPTLPHKLVLGINRWNWTGGPNFTGQLNTQKIISKMKALPYDIDVEISNQTDGVNSNIGRVWTCSLTSDISNLGQSCYGNRNGGYAFGDIGTYFTDHLFQYLTGARDYEVPIFQFNVTEALDSPVFDGYALSNYLLSPFTPTLLPSDRQTLVVTSRTPAEDAFSGHGALLEHEVGHHLGFSHSFGGYACFTDTCGVGGFAPFSGNSFWFFAKVAMYTTGLMTYVNLNNDYSRFELDNIERWLTWEELDVSNFIVSQIAQSPRAPSVAGAITQADALAGAALAAYKTYNYESAQKYARAAYDALLAAANSIDVQLSPSAYQAIRRNPADFNQAMRDFIATSIGDNHAEMTGSITSTMHGLETHPLLQPTTPLVVKLPHPKTTSLH